ncbi:hypothetical protein AAC387_Pa08g1110 [Persea americana]
MDIDSLTNVPPWVQFPTTVSLRSHEAIPILKLLQPVSSGVTDLQRYETTIESATSLRSMIAWSSARIGNIFWRTSIKSQSFQSDYSPFRSRKWMVEMRFGLIASGSTNKPMDPQCI